jgi:hypothetical protein
MGMGIIKERLRDYAFMEAGWLTWLMVGYSAGGLPLLLQSAVSLVSTGTTSSRREDAAAPVMRRTSWPCAR